MSTFETVRSWQTTNAGNAASDAAIASGDTQYVNSLDDNVRSIMVAVRKQENDTGGALTGGGAVNALTVTTGQVLEAGQLVNGLRLLVTAPWTNTLAAVTFAPDGLTAAAIKRADGGALLVGTIIAGQYLDLVYHAGTSEWWAVNIDSAAPAPLTGVTDGSNAAAGQIGEFLTQINFGPAALTTGTPTNMIILSLPAGDWNVWGEITFQASVGLSGLNAALNTVSATFPGSINQYAFLGFTTASVTAAGLVTPTTRFNVAVSTNIYLIAQATFASGTCNCTAIIYARRVR